MTQTSKMGDTAVDGLLAGLAAGVVMLVYLVLAGFAQGESPLTVMGYFSPAGSVNPVLGVLAHLAVSAIYGALFGVLLMVPGLRSRAAAAGAVYGLTLYLLAHYVLIPETQSSLQAFTQFHLVMAHILYGLVLGWRIRNRDTADSELG